MILFTKPNCEKCDWIKANCDLSGVSIQELDDNPEALGLLAYYECVVPAQKSLPILVTSEELGPFGVEVFTDVAEIAKEIWKQSTGADAGATQPKEDCGDACALGA